MLQKVEIIGGKKVETIGKLKNADVSASAVAFREALTVEFNGQTMFPLTEGTLLKMPTAESKELTKLYINNALYLYGDDWTITGEYLQWINTDVPLQTNYRIVLLRG